MRPGSLPHRTWRLLRLLAIMASSLLLPAVVTVAAQQPTGRVVITSNDASAAPTIILRGYGMDGQGNRLNLATEPLTIRHDGVPVNDVEIIGNYRAGTFTVFLVDIPPGVASQLPAVQETIEQFTSPPNMEEGVDYVAIYRVDTAEASQQLAPTNFYNSVRNFFAEPLGAQSGPTALVDSVGTLLQEISALKPKPDLVPALVVLTDGTDVVSTTFDPEELPSLAESLGIPVHTIWLRNENLGEPGQEQGRTYLSQLSAGSRGLARRLDEPAELQALWERITAFRAQNVLQYTPENLAGGEFEVVLSLNREPSIETTTTVTIPASVPTVSIELPPESRQLTLPDLEDPVRLSFTTSVTWLDGLERELTSAELVVNESVVVNIDVDSLDRFTAEIDNFVYGPNTVQVVVVDDQDQRGASPKITLTIEEGETVVPEEIQARGLQDSPIIRFALGCAVVVGVLVLLAIVAIAARRWRVLQQLGIASRLRRLPLFRRRSRELARLERYGRRADQLQRDFGQPEPEPAEGWQSADDLDDSQVEQPGEPTATFPYLEIVESVTRMPEYFDLTGVEHRVGRSPDLADLAFENDITVSRIHASIVVEQGEYRIYDEGSTSGTWVNDQPVPENGMTLVDGDEILLGAARMRFRWS